MRYKIIDELKGIAIILVVYGHVIQYNMSEYENDFLFRLIYTFHMPLFMLLSGYISYEYMNKKSLIHILFKKFVKLVIPFLSWTFINSYIVNEGSYMEILSYIMNIIVKPDRGLWFLWVLYLCFISLSLGIYIINKIQIVNTKIVSIIILGLVFLIIRIEPIDTFGLELLKGFLPYFFTGYLANENKRIILLLLNKVKEYAFALFPILFIGWSRTSTSMFVDYLQLLTNVDLHFIEIGYKYFVSLTGIICIYFILKNNNNLKIKSLLRFMGRHTFEVYVIHFYFINLGIHLNGIQFLFYIYAALATAFIIIVTLFIGYLIKQSTIMKKILIGN